MVTKGPLGTEAVPHKHGHNDGPSQVETRPPPPAPVNTNRTHFVSDFAVGDMVHADSDRSIAMTVTAHMFRGSYVVLECSWFAQQGAQQQAWIEEWRLRAM